MSEKTTKITSFNGQLLSRLLMHHNSRRYEDFLAPRIYTFS